jgi:hypothetical protein
MAYAGVEKRRFDRIECHFMTSYRLCAGADVTDTTQLKNLSSGGILLTTCQPLQKGALCALKIRVPFAREPLVPIGKVVESREVVRGLIYNTRFQFSDVSATDRKVIGEVLACWQS